jgi:hypothetical protein
MRFILSILVIGALLMIGSNGWAEESQTPAPSGQSASPPSHEQPAPQPAEATPEPAPAPPPSELAPSSGGAAKEKSAQQSLEQTQEEKEKKKIETTPETSLIKGRLQVEVIETYVHTSSNSLFIEGLGLLPVLILGPIEVQKIQRDILNTTLVIRYKLTDKLQASINIPWQLIFTRVAAAAGTAGGGVTVNPTSDNTTSTTGLGDINGNATYQLLNEALLQPSVTVALGFKARTGQDIFETDTPTGSGYNSISVSINASKSSEPAVVFGYLSYAYAISRRDVVFTPPNLPARTIDYEPGDNVGFGFGIAYALNYKLTLSTQFQESINLPSAINQQELSNSMTNSASLRFGGTWRVNDKTTIDLSLSAGLTSDSADFILSLRVPWRF